MKYLIFLIFIFQLAHAQGDNKEEGPVIKWQKATFAGGLFWFLDEAYDKTPGVKVALSGYANGKPEYPYFDEVSAGKTTHYFAVQVEYDPAKIKYQQLLDIYWRNINPLDGKGQFIDRGKNFTTAIIFHDKEQQKLAEESLKEISKIKKFKEKITTKILPFANFYPAASMHQNAYETVKEHVARYRRYSGRDTLLKELWEGIIDLKSSKKK